MSTGVVFGGLRAAEGVQRLFVIRGQRSTDHLELPYCLVPAAEDSLIGGTLANKSLWFGNITEGSTCRPELLPQGGAFTHLDAEAKVS